MNLRKAVLLTLIVFCVFVSIALAQEDETLELHRTNFSSTKYFDVFHNIFINTTSETLTLSPLGASLIIENFTSDWTETDGYLAITVHNSSAFTYDGNFRGTSNTWLTRSVNSHTDFNYTWKQNVNSITLNTRTSDGTVFQVCDFTEDYTYLQSNGYEGIFIIQRTESGVNDEYALMIFISQNTVVNKIGQTGVLNITQNYWVKFNRSGYDMDLLVYSDAEMTSLVTSTSGDADPLWTSNYAFDRLMALANLGQAVDVHNDMTMFDLTLGNYTEGFEPIGETYTENLLPNATEKAFSLLLNSSSLDSNINVEVSDDNSSWVSLENLTNREIELNYYDLEPFNWTSLYVHLILSDGEAVTPFVYNFQYQNFYNDSCPPCPDPEPCPPSNETIINEVYGEWAEYDVSSITVIYGIYDVGTLNSTRFVDGDVYRVNETVGADCLEVRMNFTNIPENSLSLGTLCYCEYEGNPAHVVNCEAWDFGLNEWVPLHVMVEHGFRWMNNSLSMGDFVENGTGNVWYRYIHVSNGANGHYLTVDYLKLRAFVPLINVDAWSINWLTSLIWLGLLAIGVFRENKILTMFAGFFGIILGLLMLVVNAMVAIALILFNLYLVYSA